VIVNPTTNVNVDVIVIVIPTVIVAALVNGNPTVDVIVDLNG
jgi:hypothetical protein